MLMSLLLRPATYFFLAWIAALIACTLLSREKPARNLPPAFQDEIAWKWLAPTPLRLRFLGGRGPQPGFGRDLIAGYAADRAAKVTEALKSFCR